MDAVSEIGGMAAVVINTLGAEAGAFVAGRLFGCKLRAPAAFGVAFIAGLF